MYQALYRKYRPKKFSDTVGQDPIVRTLKNSIVHQKTSHAYLFSGPRGTGKTTTAKIFAQVLNCESPIEGEPCGKCTSCLEAASHECVDIVEIDAASNNGVDEIRELKEKVNLVPSSLKYKVYIIDEVHMLSIGAFNALLKTLEEPPSHVVFILATTDLHKVPITIVSRCQCFTFKRIGSQDMIDRLKKISDLENISIETDVLAAIAEYSDGGMRDALGLLDKLAAYRDATITVADFNQMNGLITKNELDFLFEKLFSHQVSDVIDEISKYYQAGKDFVALTEQLLLYVRDLFVEACQNSSSTKYDKEHLFELTRVLNELGNTIKTSMNPKIMFEVSLISFMNSMIVNPQKNVGENKVRKRTMPQEKKESMLSLKQPRSSNVTVEKSKGIELSNVNIKDAKHVIKTQNLVISSELIAVHMNNAFAGANKKVLEEYRTVWPQLSEYTFDEEIGYLVCILLDGTPRVASKEYLVLSYEYESTVVKAYENEKNLLSVLSKVLNIKTRLVFLTNEQWEKEKVEYIRHLKEHIPYEYQEEPSFKTDNFQETTSTERTKDVTMELEGELPEDLVQITKDFGDIVEVK